MMFPMGNQFVVFLPEHPDWVETEDVITRDRLLRRVGQIQAGREAPIVHSGDLSQDFVFDERLLRTPIRIDDDHGWGDTFDFSGRPTVLPLGERGVEGAVRGL
jgi:hypothetical protein